jgi:hypothetical protein
MADVTNPWEIPYPETTDTLCDGYLYTQAIAERVDEILDAFDVTLANALVRPLARISTNTSQTVQSDGSISFSQVDFDTANLASQYLFGTLTSPDDAILIYGLHGVWEATPASAGAQYQSQMLLPDRGQESYYTQADRASAARGGLTSMDRNTAAGQDVQTAAVFYSGQAVSPIVSSAIYWILKIGDVV